MKKSVFILFCMISGLFAQAQSTRMSLYEEFTGETCPPCAATNPGLNLLLAQPTNTTKIIPIKWQVPIPSAPSNTWSLYQTNKVEIDWRWRSVANGGYGYSPAINSAPSSKIDGQEATVFGAASGHPANLNSGVIATAQSYTTPFSIAMTRAWDNSGTAVNLTITVSASSNFNAVGNLRLRTVMVERLINFSVQPGTNGEKDFEDAVIKSFPSIQTGNLLQSAWTSGQSQTFTMSCAIPSYTRKITEIAMVSFIQDDGNQKIWQAARADKMGVPNDAEAISVNVPAFTCGNSISPVITVQNSGITAITDLTITPLIDGVAANATTWNGNLAIGATTTISLGSVTTSIGGGHILTCNITGVSGTDYNTLNNTAKSNIYLAYGYQGTSVVEPFAVASFPPANWGAVNTNNGPAWTRMSNVGAYALLPFGSMKYDFFSNTVINDVDEMILPPVNLGGTDTPTLSFDIAKAFRSTENDMLEVMVSTDCGATWVTVFTKSGTALATWPNPITSNYFPTTAGEWRTEVVPLNGFNNSTLLVKFVTTNNHGNNMFIDNVNLSQNDPVGVMNYNRPNYLVNLYPNPSNGETNVNINTIVPTPAKLKVVNALGQIVFVKETNLVAGNNDMSFDAAQFANGIYSVIVESNYGSVVKKLTVTK